MSKELDEVIAVLENITDFCSEEGIYRAIKILEALNKPAQYVVKIERKGGEPGVFFYEATCNNKRPIERSNTLKLMKEYVFAKLNVMAEILSLPPITMEQITFVEV